MKRESGLRNLEQIQESASDNGGRLGTLLLASLGGACLVFTGIAYFRNPMSNIQVPSDPLAQLAMKSPAASARVVRGLGDSDVTFPQLLSDDPRPTTALAAIRKHGSKQPQDDWKPPPGTPSEPPIAGDRLPVVPLPAQRVINSAPWVSSPRDGLVNLAKERTVIDTNDTGIAEEGSSGAFVLQISSFREESEAKLFAIALRKRNHHAYVQQATIPDKGVWFRVRLGPFTSGWKAKRYAKEFETKEHMVPYVVDSEREKKMQEEREASYRERAERKKHRKKTVRH
jgi:DedD protein